MAQKRGTEAPKVTIGTTSHANAGRYSPSEPPPAPDFVKAEPPPTHKRPEMGAAAKADPLAANAILTLAQTQAANLFNVHAGAVARRLADRARIRYQDQPKPTGWVKPLVGPFEPPGLSEWVDRVADVLDRELYKISKGGAA